jgi:hypothetical protein
MSIPVLQPVLVVDARFITEQNPRNVVFHNSSGGSGGYSGDGCAGCASVLGIGALIVIALPLIILGLIFGDGFWSFLGSAISFILNLVWTIIKFIFEGIWWIISRLFDLIF